MKAIDLMKKRPVGKLVTVGTPSLAAWTSPDGWNKFPAHSFPEHILLNGGYVNGSHAVCLQYLNFATLQYVNVNVPNDFKLAVKRKDSKVHKEIMLKYDEYKLNQGFVNELRHTFYIGSDPEVFAEDKDGGLVPAFSFLPSKEKPVVYQGSSGYSNKLYWDGFQAEFDTVANSCLDGHTTSVHHGLLGTYQELIKKDKDARLSIRTTFDIPEKLMAASADEHVAFGCMPSLNIYGMEGLKANGRDIDFRSAGGHIHFGLNTDYYTGNPIKRPQEEIERVVKALDAILGVACVSLFAKYDNPKRRVMYGMAGEYRLPPHGLEYRTLSNAWLSHPLIMNIVLDLSRRVVMVGLKDFLGKLWKYEQAEVIRIINECDVAAARKLLTDNKESFKKILFAIYNNKDKADIAYEIFLNGMESVIDKPEDIVGNWSLDEKLKFVRRNMAWYYSHVYSVHNKVVKIAA